MFLVLLAVTMVLMTAGGMALLAFTQVYFIPSPAMEPTLNVGDRILVNTISYERSDVQRGDVVIFKGPQNDARAMQTFVKRVVAVGGDTIESRPDGLYVNDRPVDEPYVRSQAGPPVTRRTIPEGQVFVMGDNRGNSADSRVLGPIRVDDVQGRAFFRIWPLGSLGSI